MKFSAHGAHNSSLYEKHLHVYFSLNFIVHFSPWGELSLNLVLVRDKEHIEVSLWHSFFFLEYASVCIILYR